ncbi:tetratricopeptide repeat protein [Planctomycetota bacterium]
MAQLKQCTQESLAESEQMARQWIKKDPNGGAYWWGLADVLRSQERYTDAVHAARQAVTLAPNRNYRALLANTLALAGQQDEAQTVYLEMLARHPERAQYWYGYAEYLLDYHGDKQTEIQEALQKASDPNTANPVDVEDLLQLQKRVEGSYPAQ